MNMPRQTVILKTISTLPLTLVRLKTIPARPIPIGLAIPPGIHILTGIRILIGTIAGIILILMEPWLSSGFLLFTSPIGSFITLNIGTIILIFTTILSIITMVLVASTAAILISFTIGLLKTETIFPMILLKTEATELNPSGR